jgi:hypothetical protein
MATEATVCPEGKIRIIASELYNDTGIDIVKDVTYYYAATGNWKDAWIETDADGYDPWNKKPLKFLLRVPNAPWFRLIGTIDKEIMIVMGTNGNFTSKVSGRLYCFANDLSRMYWNNHGCVCLQISDKPV